MLEQPRLLKLSSVMYIVDELILPSRDNVLRFVTPARLTEGENGQQRLEAKVVHRSSFYEGWRQVAVGSWIMDYERRFSAYLFR